MDHTLRRIVVTGSTGFVGCHLLPLLAKAFPDAQIDPWNFDLREPGSIVADLRADPPDACVHLAAVSAVPAAQADPHAAWQVNLHGSLSLARALREAAPGCILLYVSTADAYGASYRGGAAVTEATALAPMNTYAATKAAADLALGAMVGEGLRLLRVRPSNHTGPGQSAAFVVASFARQVARIAAGIQAPQILVGSLDPQRDFLDVRDVCRAYVICLRRAKQIPSGTILNIASGTPRRVGDVLTDLLALAGIAAEISIDPSRLRGSDIPRACSDPSAAKAVLGWAAEIDWQTTLADTLSDWRARVAAESTSP